MTRVLVMGYSVYLDCPSYAQTIETNWAKGYNDRIAVSVLIEAISRDVDGVSMPSRSP